MAAEGSSAFSACKYTKYLFSTKQNVRKKAAMQKKTIINI